MLTRDGLGGRARCIRVLRWKSMLAWCIERGVHYVGCAALAYRHLFEVQTKHAAAYRPVPMSGFWRGCVVDDVNT